MSDQQSTILPQQLDELTALANHIGAQGIFLIRRAKDARLLYYVVEGTERGRDDTPINLDVEDTSLLVLMRFPDDGGEPGIESR